MTAETAVAAKAIPRMAEAEAVPAEAVTGETVAVPLDAAVMEAADTVMTAVEAAMFVEAARRCLLGGAEDSDGGSDDGCGKCVPEVHLPVLS